MTAPLADFDTEVRLVAFQGLSDSGRPPSHAEMARRLGTSEDEIRESLGRLAANRVIVLKPGTSDIWMANPFSAIDTAFAVTANDARWHGNCIWDALGVLALVKRDGLVESSCPDCTQPLTVEVVDGALRPCDAVVHFAVPAAHWWDDIGYT